MTGQERYDSDEFAGAITAAQLVNALATEVAYGRAVEVGDPQAAVAAMLADDPTWPAVRARDLPGLVGLALRLREVFDQLGSGDVDAAARALNAMLAAHPAHPHLAFDAGRWRLHHHPVDAGLVGMATAITAEALARLVGAGAADRLGTCASERCERVFLDGSRNGSRRFCSVTCQNRVKAATFRGRRAAARG
jgi:predicted RNA-binding Zn ribbon-like protein